MKRLEVYAVIDSERTYQLRKWGDKGTARDGGSPHAVFESEEGAEARHEVAAFLTYMRHYLSLAEQAASLNNNDTPALEGIRKVIGLGVACLEQHGCPPRV